MLFPLAFYRVAGDSMAPTYRPGDLLLGWRWFRPKPGQVVVVRTPELIIIKRIKELHDTNLWLEGDHPAHSTDSRTFGAVPREQAQAVIIAKLA